MSKAKEFNTISRRAVLAGIGSAPAAVICTSALAAASSVDDRGILGLCHAYHEVSRSLAELPWASDRELEELLDRKYELIVRLAEAQARTPDEIVAKARIVRAHLPDYLPVFESETENPEIRLALSLTADVITANGGAIA
ncbi:hypothetical protein JK169_10450 [Acetobacter persici]|uniref:hypothetical protein n=1 Tax=Acetobacter persici TaxID=1076596 RepID=UPI001BA91763|nr:hypothetical protein [Acetobacter persici]MBS1001421.1 hypothetical protein [Acetobacter persici]